MSQGHIEEPYKKDEADLGASSGDVDNMNNGEDPGDEINDFLAKKDGYRHVMFGQIADGLLPPHSGEPESTDTELSQAALSAPLAPEVEKQNTAPTPWRAIAVVAMIAVALAIVFWKK
jgi:hypothetical protein